MPTYEQGDVAVVKNDGLSLPILTTDFSQNPLLLTSFIRLHKVFLLNESLIIKKSTAITSAFHQQLVSKIIALFQ